MKYINIYTKTIILLWLLL